MNKLVSFSNNYLGINTGVEQVKKPNPALNVLRVASFILTVGLLPAFCSIVLLLAGRVKPINKESAPEVVKVTEQASKVLFNRSSEVENDSQVQKDLEEENQRLKTELDVLKQTPLPKPVAIHNEKLQKDLNDARRENIELKEQIEASKDDSLPDLEVVIDEQLQKDLNAANEKMEQLTEELQRLKDSNLLESPVALGQPLPNVDNNEELLRELKTAQEEEERLGGEVKQLKEVIGRLNTSFKEEAANMKAEHALLLENNKHSQDQELNKLRNANERMRTENSEIQHENKNLHNQIADLESQLKRSPKSSPTIVREQTEIEIMKGDDQKLQIKDLKEEIVKLRNENASLIADEKAVVATRERAQAKMLEKDTNADQLEELKTALNTFMNDYNADNDPGDLTLKFIQEMQKKLV